jgi:hypothetical protein
LNEWEDIFESHSHVIVIGRVLDIPAPRTAALAYWEERYVAIDQDALKLADRAKLVPCYRIEIPCSQR